MSQIQELLPGAEQFSAETVEPFRFVDPERHQIAMREAEDVVFMKAANGQRFSGLHLNRDFKDKPALVRVGSMNSASTTASQKYTAYEHAAKFPENPVVAIDLPSHGWSDRHTFRQRTERLVQKSGSLTAAAQAEAVTNYMTDSEEFIISGDSFGAQLAPDVATKIGLLGLKPLLLTGFDMTGVNYFNTRKTFLRLNKARKNGHSAYHSGGANLKLDAAFNMFCEELDQLGDHEQTYNPFYIGKSDPLFTALTVLRSTTNSESGMMALERSLELNPTMTAAMASGGLSKICNWRKIEPTVDALRGKFGDRLTWQIWPKDSHSMSIAPQQPRQIAFTKAAMDKYLPGSQ